MRFSTIKLYLEESIKSLFRNGLMSVSSIITVSACVFIVLISFTVATTVEGSVSNLEDTVGMSVFLNEDASNDEVNELRELIMEIPNVETATYVGKEEALDRFIEDMDEFEDVLAFYEDNNPLPRSFDITLVDNTKIDTVIDRLESKEMKDLGVDTVRHSKNISEVLLMLNRIVRIVSIVLVVLLVFLAVIIIMNTIKLTVNNRKNEIGIMKFIGATDWFIKWPFVIEGVIIGVVGAIIPLAICWLSYTPIINKVIEIIPAQLGGLFVFKSATEIFPIFAPIGLIFGAAIGAVGSIISMRRYLEV